MNKMLSAGVITLVLAAAGAFSGVRADTNDSAWELPKLPVFQFPTQEYYPETARRKGLEGRVLMAFDITPAGRAKNVTIVWAEDTVLGAWTKEIITGSHFSVPPDWGTSGALLRWRVGFVYCLLPPSGQSDAFAIPVEKITITGTRIPGAPIRIKAEANRASQCNPHAGTQ